MASRAGSVDPPTRIEAVFEALDYPTALIGPQGVYRTVNRAFAALLRADPESLRERAFTDNLHPDDREGCAILVVRLLAGGAERANVSKRLLAADGEFVEASLSFAPLGEPDAPTGVLVTAIPVAAQPIILPRMNDEDHPLSRMSHELRTPLNAIMGFSELIKSETLGPIGNDRYREYADDIHRSGHRLLTVISGLLESVR